MQVARNLKKSLNALPEGEDIVMEGMVHLRLSIWTYSDARGTTFATHAWPQLEGRLRAALYGKDRVVQLPPSEMVARRR